MLQRAVTALAMIMLCGALVAGRPDSVRAQTANDQADGEVFSPECGCNRRPPAVVQGSYSGQITNSPAGAGTLHLTLEQHTRQLHGTWNASFENGQSVSGNVSGHVGSKAVNVKLLTADPKCHYHVLATVETNPLQGTLMASKRCTDDNSGNFTINRQ